MSRRTGPLLVSPSHRTAANEADGRNVILSRSYTVTFGSVFTLPGLERSYPPGSYIVHADDEQLDVSFEASRRVATTILLKEGPLTRAWLVKSVDLDAALVADAASKPRG